MLKKSLWEKEQYMISQKGLKQLILPQPTAHSASWDALLTSDNRLFFSLCSERTTSELAKLAEYDYDTNTAKECFYIRNTQIVMDRYIRDSKFHTAVSEMEDGNLIMVTHTTDKAPAHPDWLPEAYYGNPWEGFPGSTLYTYNVTTGEVRNLGLIPRESIYGAAYDKKNRMYYMMGLMRGHMYRYSMETGEMEDMGQITERKSYRMKEGSDGHLYYTTRSGWLQRVNTDTNELEDLNIQMPNSAASKQHFWGYMCEAANGPDGKMYMSVQYHDELVAYDPKTNTLENLGNYLGAEEYLPDFDASTYIGAMDFDGNGVLWMAVCNLKSPEGQKVGASLIRWDVTRGGKPELMGVPGTPQRAIKTTSGLFVDKERQILYIVGSNHGDDAVDVNAIDLNEFEKDMYNHGPAVSDPYLLADSHMYDEYHAGQAKLGVIQRENSASFKCEKIIPIRLWRQMPFAEMADSKVRSIRWENDQVTGICGTDKFYAFRIDMEGNLLEFKPTDERPAVKEVPEELKDLKYAYYPGRQYKAHADKALQLCDGSWLVATLDGVMSKVKDGDVYNLGTLWSSGAVYDMCWVEEKQAVYGVAGDPDDLGYVFRYSEKSGLENLGRVTVDNWQYGNSNSSNLSCCAVNGNVLAIGAEDLLGTVYLCTL